MLAQQADAVRFLGQVDQLEVDVKAMAMRAASDTVSADRVAELPLGSGVTGAAAFGQQAKPFLKVGDVLPSSLTMISPNTAQFADFRERTSEVLSGGAWTWGQSKQCARIAVVNGKTRPFPQESCQSRILWDLWVL